MKHVARKRFGQHFLADAAIIDAIVREIAPKAGQPVVEIGPGLAALTQPLVERLGALIIEATYNFRSPLLYATVFTAALLAVVLFALVSVAEARLIKWKAPAIH